MKIIQGDLIQLALNGEFDVIIHGCNCFCTMGAGIAKSIKSEFPEAYQADLETIKGNSGKLGTFSYAKVIRDSHEITVINAYSQFHWKGFGNKVVYSAIRNVFKDIKKNYSGKKIGYPLIGCGLAGGDWDLIGKIIESELSGEEHTLVKFSNII